jgi:hypothetical protein
MIASVPLVLLLIVSFLGPALLLTKRFRGTALERLTAGFGLSGIVLYLLTFGIYAFNLPQESHWGVTAACVVALLFSLGELRRLWADPSLRLPGLAFLFVAFWVALHLLIVRNFSGGGWFGDWFEHYQRTIFFLDRAPLDARFLDFYSLPARPPLMNIITGHFLTHVEPSFVHYSFVFYQIAMAAMGLLVCLPLLLFVQPSDNGGGRVVFLLVFLLALNPMFLQNATYAWTRPLANFYILTGLYFYWRGVSENDTHKTGLSFLMFAAAILTHYSAGPYAVCVLAHLLFRLWKFGVREIKSLLAPAFAAALLLLTWFGWSLAYFGPAITLGSNTTVLGAQGRSLTEFLSVFFYNLTTTFVPFWFRSSSFVEPISIWNKMRDSVFLVAQTNLIGAVGLTAGALLIYQTAKEVYGGSLRNPAWRFWAGMSIATILLSIAVNDQPDDFGVAHICLQPMVLLGVVRLSVVTWERGWPFRALLGLGAFAGYGLGILLQFWLEGMSFVDRQELLAQMSLFAQGNWRVKTSFNLVFIGDYAADYQKVFLVVEIFTALCLFAGFVLWCRRLNDLRGR